jgi:hypothetical protein
MPFCRLLAAAACGLALAGPAQAFTVEGGPAANGAASRWQDLDLATPKADAPASRLNSENGRTTFKNGNSTFYFGRERTLDPRYSTDNLFNPYLRDGRQ